LRAGSCEGSGSIKGDCHIITSVIGVAAKCDYR